ncbi:MAG: dihydrodipicolinate synthase [Paenibacillus sp.]|jgi:4-hydroxy-tetrahydrodipicolinate synthase|nr:dihydrodipicolinate synthase [Paenibacillus sp.]
MSSLKLHGVIPPILTPFLPDRSVDIAALSGLADYMIEGGVTGIFAMGTAGESPLLTRAQREQALTAIARRCAGKVRLLVGILEASTERVLELIPEAEQLGASAIVVTTPYYYPVKQPEIVKHFAAVREATELPIVVYNIPSRTMSPLAPATVNELARFPQVIGYKDSSGDMSHFQAVQRLTRDLPHFALFQGSHSLSIPSLLIGAHGLVPGLGNIVPRQIVEMAEHVRENRLEQAYAAQDLLLRLESVMDREGYSLAVLKAMIQLLGFGQGVPNRPLPAVSAEGLKRLEAVFRTERLLRPDKAVTEG